MIEVVLVTKRNKPISFQGNRIELIKRERDYPIESTSYLQYPR